MDDHQLQSQQTGDPVQKACNRNASTRAVFVILACLVISQPLSAQRPQVASFPNPVGSGARAAGMGDAFISIADDATAASWNPACLILLERPEFSAAGEFMVRDDDWNFEDTEYYEFDQKDGGVWNGSLNYLSVAYPFRALDRNWVVSLNYQKAYRFDRRYDVDYTIDAEDLHLDNHFEYLDEGALYTLSPAIGVRITPRLSVGLTTNFWMDDLQKGYAWRESRRYESTGSFGDLTAREMDEYDDLFGVNFNVGLRYEATRHLTLGLVFKSPFEASLQHRHKIRSFEGGTPNQDVKTSRTAELDFPWVIGAGASWRFNDRFTVAGDVTRTDWEHFVVRDDGERRHLVTGKDPGDADVEATYTVRLGAEYLFIGQHVVVPVRWGMAYDPEPSRENPDTAWTASVGSGVVIGNRASLDFAYQYRFGEFDAGPDFGTLDVDQHRFLMSLILYW